MILCRRSSSSGSPGYGPSPAGKQTDHCVHFKISWRILFVDKVWLKINRSHKEISSVVPVRLCHVEDDMQHQPLALRTTMENKVPGARRVPACTFKSTAVLKVKLLVPDWTPKSGSRCWPGHLHSPTPVNTSRLPTVTTPASPCRPPGLSY